MVGSSSAYSLDPRGPQIYGSNSSSSSGITGPGSLGRPGDVPMGMISGSNAGLNMALDERNREPGAGTGGGAAVVPGVPQPMPMPMLLQTYQQSEQLHMLHTQQHLRLQEAQLQEKLNLVQRQRRMQQNLIAATQQFTYPHQPQQSRTQTLNPGVPTEGNTDGAPLAVASGTALAVVSGTPTACPSSELIDLSNAESSDEEVIQSADIVPYRAEGFDEEEGAEERGISFKPTELPPPSLLSYGAPLLPSLPSLSLNSTMRGHFEAAVATAYPAKTPSTAISSSNGIADLKNTEIRFEPFTFPSPLPVSSTSSTSSYHPILPPHGDVKRDAAKGVKHPSYWDYDKSGVPSMRMGVDVSGQGMERVLEAAQIALNLELHGRDPGPISIPTTAPLSLRFIPGMSATHSVTGSTTESEREGEEETESERGSDTHVEVTTATVSSDSVVDSLSNVGSNLPTVHQSTTASAVQHETPSPSLPSDELSAVAFIPIPTPSPAPSPRASPDPFLIAMMRRRMTEEMQNPPVVKSFDPPGTTGKKVTLCSFC